MNTDAEQKKTARDFWHAQVSHDLDHMRLPAPMSPGVVFSTESNTFSGALLESIRGQVANHLNATLRN